MQIFAVGGGGFTHPEDNYPHDAILEDHLLALAGPMAKIRIGYIGHASNDNPAKIDTFYKRFNGCANITSLPLGANLAEARVFVAARTRWRSFNAAAALSASVWRALILCSSFSFSLPSGFTG